MYVPSSIAIKRMKQRLTEVDVDQSTVTAGGLNTPLPIILEKADKNQQVRRRFAQYS